MAEQNDKQVKAFCCMQVLWHLRSPADVEQRGKSSINLYNDELGSAGCRGKVVGL